VCAWPAERATTAAEAAKRQQATTVAALEAKLRQRDEALRRCKDTIMDLSQQRVAAGAPATAAKLA
jgi:hypothetical protein